MPSTINAVLPRYDCAEMIVAAPATGPGNWAGAATVVLVDGTYWLSYRVRRPVQSGRGVAVVVARSADGVTFETVCEIGREAFGAASFERPVVLPISDAPDAGWRLYLSCATPNSKHWWIEAVDAATPADLPNGTRRVVLPGTAAVGVKDPVIVREGDAWEMWVCCHPLTQPGQEDRMTTRHLRSSDGLAWQDMGEVLRGTPGRWDARGARVTAVLSRDPLTVLYDGRDSAEANWYEATGLAVQDPTGDRLMAASPDSVAASPVGSGALRYVSVVGLADGQTRFYFEASRPDGSHDLMTSVG